MTTVTAKQKKSIAQVQLALKLLCVPTEFHLLTSTNEIRILDIQIHIKKRWMDFFPGRNPTNSICAYTRWKNS